MEFFGGVKFGLGVFLGFDFGSHLISPVTLKSRVPPWVPTLLASLSFSFFPFRPSFNLLTSLPFLPFAFFESLASVTPSTWPLTFLCIPFSSTVNLLPSSHPFLSHQFCLFPCWLSYPFSFPSLVSSICLSPLLISPNLPSRSHPNRCNIVHQKLRLFAHHVACCWVKFETGQTFEPTFPNISFVPWWWQCWIHLHSHPMMHCRS